MNKKIYALLIILGLILFSHNYWGEFGKTSFLNIFGSQEEEIDYSWLSTYENNNSKVLRKVSSEFQGNEEDEGLLPDIYYDEGEGKDLEYDKERSDFIEASYKASCVVFSLNGVFTEESENFVISIFEEKGFPARNQRKMQALIDKYKNDNDYIKAILSASIDCLCKEGEELSLVDFKCVN